MGGEGRSGAERETRFSFENRSDSDLWLEAGVIKDGHTKIYITALTLDEVQRRARDDGVTDLPAASELKRDLHWSSEAGEVNLYFFSNLGARDGFGDEPL